MQLVKQVSVNEAKYSIVSETIVLREREVNCPWQAVTARSFVLGHWEGNAVLDPAHQRQRWKTNWHIIIAPQTVGSLLQIKSQASPRKERGTLAITKTLNHSSCTAQQETVALGKQSCTKMKCYMWRKFRSIGRKHVNMTRDRMYSLKNKDSRAEKS